MPVLVGVTMVLPLRLCRPVHASVALHQLAYRDDHSTVADWPSAMLDGVTARLSVGCGGGQELLGGATHTVAAALAEPPLPVQLTTYSNVESAVVLATPG